MTETRLSGILIRTGSIPTSALGGGVVSSSAQIITALPAGTFSGSAQVIVQNTTGIGALATTGSNTFTGVQSVTDITNSTNYTDGAVVISGGLGVGKNVNISGSLTVDGLLTVVSMSTQYVTSSQYTVGTSRIILNDDAVVRFAGMSVVDSGSTDATGSILWDSFRNHWIYENASGSAYNSAIIIAGPKTTGSLGTEPELIVGRIPVATGGDHIDTDSSVTPLRVEGTILHVENGVYVTGSVSSSVGFSGNGAGLTNVTAASVAYADITDKPTLVSASSQVSYSGLSNIPADIVSSSTQVKAFLPDGTVSSSTQYPGWVTASSQIDYTQLQNIPSGIASSSAQVTAFLPNGTVSSSGQVQLSNISGTTFATADFTFPQNLTVAGTLTAEVFQTEYLTSSIIYESGSTKFGDTADDTHQFTGSLLVQGPISASGITGSFSGSGAGLSNLPLPTINGNLSILQDAVTIPSGYTALFVGPIDNEEEITVEEGGRLIITDFESTQTAVSSSFATTASYAVNGGWLRNKAGSIANGSFAGTPRKAAVNFTTAFPNTSYAVVITGEDARTWTIEGKVAGGFTASANSNVALDGTTYWVATTYGET